MGSEMLPAPTLEDFADPPGYPGTPNQFAERSVEVRSQCNVQLYARHPALDFRPMFPELGGEKPSRVLKVPPARGAYIRYTVDALGRPTECVNIGSNGETLVFRVAWSPDRMVATTAMVGVAGVSVGSIAFGKVTWIQGVADGKTSWLKYQYNDAGLPAIAIRRLALSPERTLFRCVYDEMGRIQTITTELWNVRSGAPRLERQPSVQYARDEASKLVSPELQAALLEHVLEVARLAPRESTLLFVLDPEEPAFAFALHRIDDVAGDRGTIRTAISSERTEVTEPHLPLSRDAFDRLNAARGAHAEAMRVARRVMEQAAAKLPRHRWLGVTDFECHQLRWYGNRSAGH